MSKIDVNKCDYSDIGKCFDNNFYKFCNLFDEPCADVRNKNRCFYQLKHKLQQLESENEELRKRNQKMYKMGCKNFVAIEQAKRLYKLNKCIDEIEEVANAIVNGTHFTTDIEGHFKELTKQILKKIKEVKGNG